jgi:diacylglycerol kinase (ATP)
VTNAVLIHNPASRNTLAPRQLDAVLAYARARGWTIDLVATERAGHATEIARDAVARGVDTVVVNGGDGSINEAANGLAGSDAALGVLPGGTANIWAKEIGVSRDPLKAIAAMVDGERRRVDLGRAGDRYFLLMAGVGLDGVVVPRTSAGLKRRIGAAAFVLAGVVAAIRTRPWSTSMTVDGADVETPLYLAVLGNTRLYGGVVRIAHRAVADDGRLDAVIMRRGGLHVIADGVRLLFRRHDRSPNVRYARVQAFDIRTPGIPVQVDGEYHAETPMRIEAVPGALTVIVPRGLRTPLLSEGPGA